MRAIKAGWKAVLVALLAMAALGGSGAAIATDGQGAPRTDDVTMQFVGTEVLDSRIETLCDSPDGLHRRLRQVYTGEALGGTNRDLTNLTGTFEAVVHTFYEVDTFEGTTHGLFVIRDAAGRLKFKGQFIGATEVSGVEGILTGHVIDVDPATPESGGELVGTFRVGVVPDFPNQPQPRPFIVEGDVGANDESPASEPAVVQVGSCGMGA